MAEKSIGAGTVLAGRFRLEDLLQETQGAKFWRATDQILARSVAVHVVTGTDPRAEALLFAARASATVTDGHFLRVLDAAEEDTVAYVVNEWAAGSSLDLMLVDGPLSARRAAWLVKEVAEAMTTAHRQGVAHGRLLPENVMVTESGAVKLIGFAIDAVLNGSHRAGSGHLVERESDVVNLAALLYAALVGRWPGSDGSKLLAAPLERGRPLRPRKVRAGVPRPLDDICERVLNAQAHHHAMPIGTAQEICAALTDFLGDPVGGLQAAPESTAVIPRDRTGGDPDATQVGVGGPSADPAPTRHPVGGPPWSASGPAGKRPPAADADATQAGAPLFFDDTSRVGWAGPAEPGSSLGDSSGTTPGAGPASPPPPFPPDPAPRPLFAPDPPGGRETRPAAEASARTGYHTGGGTGSLPAVWGPDADDPEPPSDGRRGSMDAGRSWLRLAAIVAACVLLLLVVIFAFNLGRPRQQDPSPDQSASPRPSPSESVRPSRQLSIAAASDFDPLADPPEENSELAELAVDGDPGTAWRTSTYFDPLAQLKDGVGLLVDLGKPVEVSQAQLTLVGHPTDLELLAADRGAALPTSAEELREVATADNAGPRVNLELDAPVTTQYLVVWLTSLPPVEGGYLGQIAEIDVRS